MIRLYTDGSCRDTDNGPVVGWAWAVVNTELPEGIQLMMAGNGRINSGPYLSSRNVTGEIDAVKDGLDYLDDIGVRDVTIFHDYYGIAKWITGEWDTKIDLTKKYRRFINYLQKGGMDIHFSHVKAHSGDHWNEYVDRLAKEAIGL